MIGQNLQRNQADRLAKNDFDVNKKAEKEIEILHQKIDELMLLVKQLNLQDRYVLFSKQSEFRLCWKKAHI